MKAPYYKDKTVERIAGRESGIILTYAVFFLPFFAGKVDKLLYFPVMALLENRMESRPHREFCDYCCYISLSHTR